jgi:hypothetical protein
MKSMLGRKVSDECAVSFIATVAKRRGGRSWASIRAMGLVASLTMNAWARLSRAAGSGVLLLQHQRHRFKNTAGIGIDAHTRAGPVP